MVAEVVRRHHRPQRPVDRLGGIGEQTRDAAHRLVLVRVEDMEDRADE